MSIAHLSSDERSATVERKVDGNRDVWVVDLERGVPRRLTFDEEGDDDGSPIFSPDGSRVAYATGGAREFFDIHERRSDGTGESTLILASRDQYLQPQDWTSDGRYILYRLQTAQNTDLWAMPLFGERNPFAITRTAFAEANGRFSPDDRWVAYQSPETGRNEIYVQPFPGPGPKLQISLSGGAQPRWGRGELFYVASDGQLMTVSVAPDGPRLRTSIPRALFKLPTVFGSYEPSSDGQRFLVNTIVSDASPITIVLNWKAPDR